jgi:hypothetical protein
MTKTLARLNQDIEMVMDHRRKWIAHRHGDFRRPRRTSGSALWARKLALVFDLGVGFIGTPRANLRVTHRSPGGKAEFDATVAQELTQLRVTSRQVLPSSSPPSLGLRIGF